ncbi:hypothetical protein CAPTEDRAFT_223035 [Capitella teleta]|uniref:E3 ubiquitin-protein ligase Topors n=1 Tax=Capitella teleta TaxID=283909 RepID=R7USL5_CAPTE|nr:hypothetical protein CAPTEDRAFT_223035 [Capitella teleta]|eukprot:ELU06401.1 hypothetical protein CAPTEDRAFT_223035 [Capitella teleta]
MKSSRTRPKKRLPELTAALARPPSPSSEKENAEAAGPSTGSGATESKGPGSPDPNCSICLGILENKSFTDGCFHTFCFVCLLEWSKVKAVCPLCKQPFKSIIHNVRSIEDYDQYHVQTPDEDPYNPNSVGARRFRYRTTVTTERWMDLQHRQNQRQMDLLQRPSRQTAAFNYRRYRQGATSSFRRRVYANGMRMRELRSERGRTVRSRDISAEFFRGNPACCHRLVPWLNRELNVLLFTHEDHVQFVLELIIDLIKRFEIQSEEFFEHIQPFFGRRTEHFVHEFLSFSRAPYDMVKYDQLAVYDEGEAHDPQNVHTIEESDSENDSEVVMISDNRVPGAPRHQPYEDSAASSALHPMQPLVPLLGQVREFLASMHWSATSTAASGWESPSGPSSSGIWAFPGDVPAAIVEVATQQSPSVPSASSNAPAASDSPRSTSDHDSDVVFIQEEKPWADRTPILLSSGSEEEIEVVSTADSKERSQKSKDRKKEDESRNKYWNSCGVCYRHDRRECSKCTRRERRFERRKMRAVDAYGVEVRAKSHSRRSSSGSQLRDRASSSHRSTSEDRRRRSRSTSLEVVYERSSSRSRHKKHKKHKHKKHKRRHQSADSEGSHRSAYKKHSSGHKGSSSAPHEIYEEIENFVRQSRHNQTANMTAQPSTSASHDRDVDSIVDIVKNLERSIDRLEPTKDRLMAGALSRTEQAEPGPSHLHFSSDEELDLVPLKQRPGKEDSLSASSSVLTVDTDLAAVSSTRNTPQPSKSGEQVKDVVNENTTADGV